MPRYFYLLCFLLSINCTFCYDYISDRNPHNKYGRRLSKKARIQKPRQGDKEYVRRKHQEYEVVEDKDPMAQIDVASFIQKPDEYAVDESPYGLDSNRRKTKLKQENDYGSLEYNPDEYIMKKSNKRPYYSNPNPDNSFDFGPSPLLTKDTINSRHSNLDTLSLHGLNNVKFPQNYESKLSSYNDKAKLYDTNTNMVHNPQKKSVLKYMKFPFFSHNKTAAIKPKKEKKRKASCINCSKKAKKPNDISSRASDQIDDTAINESLKTVDTLAMNSPGDNFDSPKTNTMRGKRDYWSNASERQRQIKELEEIQRKVDSVEIMPIYEKSSQNS